MLLKQIKELNQDRESYLSEKASETRINSYSSTKRWSHQNYLPLATCNLFIIKDKG